MINIATLVADESVACFVLKMVAALFSHSFFTHTLFNFTSHSFFTHTLFNFSSHSFFTHPFLIFIGNRDVLRSSSLKKEPKKSSLMIILLNLTEVAQSTPDRYALWFTLFAPLP